MASNLIITAHIDHNFNQTGLQLGYDDYYTLKGTLDNLIGCMALSRFWGYLSEHGVYFYYTQNEEAGQRGAKNIANVFDPNETIIINVDVDEITDPYVVCQIDNVSGFSKKETKDLKDTILYWFDPEYKYKIPIHMYEKVKDNVDFQDDAWVFAKHGFKTLTLTCPVQGNFHSTGATISISTFERYCRCLECVLKYFIDEIENQGGDF